VVDAIEQPQGLISHLLFAAISSSASILLRPLRCSESSLHRPPDSAPWLALVEIQTLLVMTLALAWFLGQHWRFEPTVGRDA